jgi:hypothetical protein
MCPSSAALMVLMGAPEALSFCQCCLRSHTFALCHYMWTRAVHQSLFVFVSSLSCTVLRA